MGVRHDRIDYGPDVLPQRSRCGRRSARVAAPTSWRSTGPARQPDALTVVDVDENSATYGQVVGWTDTPGRGDELHHFGWNACSSALKHEGHDMTGTWPGATCSCPGLRSSNIYVYDTQPDPRAPRLVKTVDADELAAKAGYSRPHTLHCGPDGVFMTCLGGGTGDGGGPGGIALLDHNTFDVLRAWEPIAVRSTSPTTRGGTSTRTR